MCVDVNTLSPSMFNILYIPTTQTDRLSDTYTTYLILSFNATESIQNQRAKLIVPHVNNTPIKLVLRLTEKSKHKDTYVIISTSSASPSLASTSSASPSLAFPSSASTSSPSLASMSSASTSSPASTSASRSSPYYGNWGWSL